MEAPAFDVNKEIDYLRTATQKDNFAWVHYSKNNNRSCVCNSSGRLISIKIYKKWNIWNSSTVIHSNKSNLRSTRIHNSRRRRHTVLFNRSQQKNRPSYNWMMASWEENSTNENKWKTFTLVSIRAVQIRSSAIVALTAATSELKHVLECVFHAVS